VNAPAQSTASRSEVQIYIDEIARRLEIENRDDCYYVFEALRKQELAYGRTRGALVDLRLASNGRET
jgi:hypothetical protein